MGSIFFLNRRKLKKRKFVVCGVMLIIIFLNFFVYPNNISGHIGLALKFVLVLFVGELISYEELETNYRKIVLWMAVISLICYTVFLIAPQVIVAKVPIVSYWGHKTRYLLVYNFPGDGYQYGQLRNYGPFHEGGMFAVFLNISVLLLMNKEKIEKKDKIELLILIVTLLTTFSTAGLIAFFVIVSFKALTNKNNKTFLFLLAILLIGVYAELKLGIISDKFTESNASFTGRMSEIPLFIEAFFKAPFWGIGYQNASIFAGTDIKNGTNGLLSLFAQFGLVGAVPFIYNNISAIRRLRKDVLLAIRDIIVLLIFWMVEPTIFQPIFLVLLFIEHKENNKYEIS